MLISAGDLGDVLTSLDEDFTLHQLPPTQDAEVKHLVSSSYKSSSFDDVSK